METIDALSLADFPTTFDQHVRALRDASKALEDWMGQSAGKAWFANFQAMNGDKKALETLAQSEEGRDEAYGPYEKALHDFQTELREFGEREFGGGSQPRWWGLFARRT
jgi:hypothetical protein